MSGRIFFNWEWGTNKKIIIVMPQPRISSTIAELMGKEILVEEPKKITYGPQPSPNVNPFKKRR